MSQSLRFVVIAVVVLWFAI